MSRDRNHLQRHIQECLADRHEMHIPAITFDHEIDDEGFLDDWEPDCEYDDDWFEDPFWDKFEYDDDDQWESPDLEYGGCYYPAAHVEHARAIHEPALPPTERKTHGRIPWPMYVNGTGHLKRG